MKVQKKPRVTKDIPLTHAPETLTRKKQDKKLSFRDIDA